MPGWNFADAWETVARKVPDAQCQVQGTRRVVWRDFNRRANGIARTLLTLVHPDLAITGTVRVEGRELVLDGARGGQAHLWGSKHAARWAWAHANDLRGLDGERRPGAYVDGVSVHVPRFGRELGPSTPIVGRFGRDLGSLGGGGGRRGEGVVGHVDKRWYGG